MSNLFSSWTTADVVRHNAQIDARLNKRMKNNETNNPRTTPKLECSFGNEPLAEGQGEKTNAGKFSVRFISVRKRLLDPDNLSCKWLLDSLRYASIISGDEPEKITLEVTQRKCRKDESEHTIVEVKAERLT